jgi:hypothetical protein
VVVVVVEVVAAAVVVVVAAVDVVAGVAVCWIDLDYLVVDAGAGGADVDVVVR